MVNANRGLAAGDLRIGHGLFVIGHPSSAIRHVSFAISHSLRFLTGLPERVVRRRSVPVE